MSDIECTHDWVSNSSDNHHTYITISTLYSRSTCIQPCRRQLPGFSCQCHYCCRSATNQSIRDARQQNPWTSCLANELQAFRTTCRHNWHTAYYMTSYASTHLINNNNNNVTYKAQIHKGSKCAMSHITVKQKCFQSLPEGTQGYSLSQLTSHHWPSFGKGENKGTKEVYCRDIVVLIVLFWCFWCVKSNQYVETLSDEAVNRYQSTDFCFPLCRN